MLKRQQENKKNCIKTIEYKKVIPRLINEVFTHVGGATHTPANGFHTSPSKYSKVPVYAGKRTSSTEIWM